MKTLSISLFFIMLVAQTAWAQVSLEQNALKYQAGGAEQSLALEDGAVSPIRNSASVFVFVDNSQVLDAAGLKKPALLFFNKEGRYLGGYAGDGSFDPEICADASMSPNGKIIALDNGTWLVRIWAFYTFPDFTPISGEEDLDGGGNINLSYFSSENSLPLAWVDNNTVITTDLSQLPVARPCPSDPCEPLDVVVHYLNPWQSHALAAGTELCDYRFSGLSGRTVTVTKTCTKNIDDWAEEKPGSRRVTKEKLQLPQQ